MCVCPSAKVSACDWVSCVPTHARLCACACACGWVCVYVCVRARARLSTPATARARPRQQARHSFDPAHARPGRAGRPAVVSARPITFAGHALSRPPITCDHVRRSRAITSAGHAVRARPISGPQSNPARNRVRAGGPRSIPAPPAAGPNAFERARPRCRTRRARGLGRPPPRTRPVEDGGLVLRAVRSDAGGDAVAPGGHHLRGEGRCICIHE